MSSQRHLSGFISVALAMVLLLLVLVPAAGATVAWSEPTSASARDALRFWTPARMRQARPLDVTGPAGGGLARSSDSSAVGQTPDEARLAASDFAEVLDATAPEFRQNGAIFIVLPGGFGTGRCSGTSVNA